MHKSFLKFLFNQVVTYLGETPSPEVLDPEHWFPAPGGKAHPLIFQPIQASWRFRVCQPGIPALFLSLSIPSKRQLISFSFSKPRPDTFLRIKRFETLREKHGADVGNVKKENRKAEEKSTPTPQLSFLTQSIWGMGPDAPIRNSGFWKIP